MTDAQAQLYERVLGLQRQRVADWEQNGLQPLSVDADHQEFIADQAGDLRTASDIHEAADHFNSALVLGALAPMLTEGQWKSEPTCKYLKIAFADTLLLGRALSIACEKRGVSSAPIARLMGQWVTHWRKHRNPRSAFLHLGRAFDVNELIAGVAESLQRILRITEPELRAPVRGKTSNASEEPKPSSEVDLGAASEVSGSSPPTRRRRARAPAPVGWIYLQDAMPKYRLRQSTAFLYAGELSTANAGDSVLDADSKQRRVREEPLRDLLRRKGRLRP